METPRLRLRIDPGDGRALGPGKIRLLEAIDKTGSISEAGRELGISYTRAWLLVDDLGSCFRSPIVKPRRGGSHGGGATLAPLGMKLVELYRSIESEAIFSVNGHLHALGSCLKFPAALGLLTSIKRPLRSRKVRRTVKVAVRISATEARRQRTDRAVADLAPVIAELRANGVTSLRGIAAALNERGIPTVAGSGNWSHPQVSRVLARLSG
jgi:molybdate transport system regulatory protein